MDTTNNIPTEHEPTIIDGFKAELPQTKKEWMWLILIVLAVACMGFYIFRSYTDIHFKYELLQTPCNLCSALQVNNGSYNNINWTTFNEPLIVYKNVNSVATNKIDFNFTT